LFLSAKGRISSATEEYLISPITGERIPASKVQEHMRIGLLDPRWVEQRDKHVHERMGQDTVYAPGTAIEASLKQLAERRTDIFGVGDEETAIGKKIGEEEKKKDDKVRVCTIFILLFFTFLFLSVFEYVQTWIGKF